MAPVLKPWAPGLVCAVLLLSNPAARAQYDSDVMNACVNALGSTLACDINGPIAPQAPQMVILHFAALAISDATLKAGASHQPRLGRSGHLHSEIPRHHRRHRQTRHRHLGQNLHRPRR